LILQFHEWPNPDGTYVARPMADITIEGVVVPVRCLIDSGAQRNRFGKEIADAAGIALPDPDPVPLKIGGRSDITTFTVLAIQLQLGEHVWTADVSFCDPWPPEFPHVLGVEGFFRHFRVNIRARDYLVEVEPEEW
jgi:hypothetical protein